MPANPTRGDLTLSRLSAWAVGYALRRRAALAAVITSMLLKVGLDVLKPLPMVFLIDYVLRGREMSPTLARLVALLPGAPAPANLIVWSVTGTVVIFLLSWAVGLVATYSNISLGQRMTYDLAGDLFAKLQQLSLHFHGRKSVGDNIRRVTADSTCVSVIVKDALLPVFSAVVTLVAMFSILWHIDSSLTLLSLAVVPYMIWVFWRYAGPMLDLSYKQQEVEGRIYDIVERTFAAIPVVQAFTREESNDRRFAQITGDTIAATLTLTNVQVRFKTLMGLATAVGTAGIRLLQHRRLSE